MITNNIYINEYYPYVHSEEVDDKHSLLHIETSLSNESISNEEITMIHSIKDKAGKTEKIVNEVKTLKRGEESSSL